MNKEQEFVNPKAFQTGIDPKIHKKGLRDRVEVFLYNNLAAMVSPHPEVLLTPSVRAALIADINWLPGGYGFPPDLQQILNAFILTNINQVSVSSLTENPLIIEQMTTQTTS
ncbi:Hypothetical protein LUCI_5042 [Lucifera butyrica]|uniref:Uncharacterized protein n=1 Tax=Lucifera butyrica TaxID=1351585 RepID=A0A498RE18_9FIRM|nr:hypothetical protein [Lucifera butyrica]VBB09744.1 Hypothetical protein LUCI_5042 [Lucifera butyrica]